MDQRFPATALTRTLHGISFPAVYPTLANRTLMPPTGSSLTAVAPVLRPSCVTHGAHASDGEADRGSQRRRRTPGDAAMPSTSPGRYPGPVPASGHELPDGLAPVRRPGPGERHHAEQYGRTKITRTEPPTLVILGPMEGGGLAPEWVICMPLGHMAEPAAQARKAHRSRPRGSGARQPHPLRTSSRAHRARTSRPGPPRRGTGPAG